MDTVFWAKLHLLSNVRETNLVIKNIFQNPQKTIFFISMHALYIRTTNIPR
jgi:hypothetical protein